MKELTPMELRIVMLLTEGLPNKIIGARVGIKEETVKVHLHKVFVKKGFRNRVEAALWARAQL